MKRREHAEKVYIAIDGDGNVYGGRSCDIVQRGYSHKKKDRTIIASYPSTFPEVIKDEKRMIHFLCNQSYEEDFDCTNKQCRR